MTDAEYEAKLKDMQKYVPFLQRVMEKLKVSNETTQEENPRKAQLQKMEMLHDLLTNKAKKIKMETLIRFEGVLVRLYAKIEKSDDSVLNYVNLKEMKNQPSTSRTMTPNAKDKEIIDITGPASPPPEVIDLDQPVVIPTERRCSPILHEKESSFSKHSDHHSKTKEKSRHHHKKSSNKSHYTDDSLQKSRQKIHNTESNNESVNKNSTDTVRHESEMDCSKDQNPISTHISTNWRHNNLSSEEKNSKKDSSKNKSQNSSQKLQTVKVIITEPLSDRIKQQHFPSSNKFMPRSSICHNNLKTLPQAPVMSAEINKVYTPEDVWEKRNDSNKNVGSYSSKPAVFSRLGEKVVEKSPTRYNSNTSPISIPSRYTPIPDVLKSPPLSANDINNLLLESGLEKCTNDISEIGSRRPPKTEDNQKKLDSSPSKILEFARKKLAQTAKLCSPNSEAKKPSNNADNPLISPIPKERIALKYNPHPRQERLQSISSTDGSECSVQSRITDPRIKSKLSPSEPIMPSSPISSANVNVLPTINLNDPRLKKQTKPISAGPNQMPGFVNTNQISYPFKVDPRISRPINTHLSDGAASAFQGLSYKSQPHYSSEEDKNHLSIKRDSRFESKDCSRIDSKIDSRFSTEENKLTKNKPKTIKNQYFHDIIPQDKRIIPHPPKSDSEEDWDADSHSETKKTVQEKPVLNSCDGLLKTSESKAPAKITNTNNYVPRPPNSDTEEDWDSEPELAVTNKKPNVPINSSPNIPLNIPPVSALISPVHSIQVSPKTFTNHTKNSPLLPTPPPQHLLQNPYTHIHHPVYGINNPPPLMPTSTVCNRFNAHLNDKTERDKYFESKKQKPFQPRTYKEFREAKERQLAQEAAMKKALEEAEAKKRAEEFKTANKSKGTLDCDKKEEKTDKSLKLNDSKEEKKSKQLCTAVKSSNLNKDQTNISAESTLDKMYRTQNFGTSFPKANISFKIPKKKTEEKTNDVTNKIDDIKTVENSVQNAAHAHKNECNEQQKATKHGLVLENIKETEDKICNNKETENINQQVKKKKEKGDTPKRNQNAEENSKKENDFEMKTQKSIPSNSNINIRDPRRKPKDTLNQKPNVVEETDEKKEDNILGDIAIKSNETEVILKPHQKSDDLEHKNKTALDKFNEIAQTLNPKPQRILRRRNTMVAFESAPLVDKDKLKKANAMLFEDIQEEEKRKQKQAEEDRQNARRIRHLEEMFQKTDDNCTVSTQNIITGKRRTRATINFNETVNAINVFKHISKKDSLDNSSNSAVPQAEQENNKNTRSATKRSIKSAEALEANKNNENHLETSEKLQDQAANDTKMSKTKEIKTKSNDKTAEKPLKPLLKVCIKLPKKTSVAKKILQQNATTKLKNESTFTPIPDDEQQNCAVSSTSADTTSEDQLATNSSSSVRSFKKEDDDNEPTSTANKSNNSTPTPEASVQVLDEIVDKMLKPNADRVHILNLLGQILSEEKLDLIKSLIESNSRQGEESTEIIKEDTNKSEFEENEEISEAEKKYSTENVEDKNQQEEKPVKLTKSLSVGKKALATKKKRNELDRLNEDIRDMFICEGVLTATGRRMCTIMGQSNNKGTDFVTQNKSTAEISLSTDKKNIKTNKKKDKKAQNNKTKPIAAAKPLRRSLRVYNTANEENNDDADDDDDYVDDDDNDDDYDDSEENSTYSGTTSIDDLNTTPDTNSTGSNTTPRRKMPVLKPNTPIKILDEECKRQEVDNSKTTKNKRKSNNKSSPIPVKKTKYTKDKSKDNIDSESEKETDMCEENQESKNITKNTNVHCHNQSKFIAWCMICEKKLLSFSAGSHYKIHHGENFISRLAPVLLQQFKKGKLSHPLFGVNKSPKQSTWFYRCPFCLQYFNTVLPLWLEHFQNHTTEFRLECSKCHYGSNKQDTIRRHLKNCKCKGATIVNTAIKLSTPTLIKGHVCHLCNFLQLRRVNLERHYIEQHKLDKQTVELLGYTINLFDVENVELVPEDKATEREKLAWNTIAKEEEIIDIDDGEEDRNTPADIENEKTNTSTTEETCVSDNVKENKKSEVNEQSQAPVESEKNINKDNLSQTVSENSKQNTLERTELNDENIPTKSIIDPTNSLQDNLKTNESQKNNESENQVESTKESESGEKGTQVRSIRISFESPSKKGKNETSQIEIINIDYELVNEKETVRDVQEELLVLADKAFQNDNGNSNQTTNDSHSELNNKSLQCETTMSDIISNSIDMIYNRSSSKNETTLPEAKKSSQNIVSNVFMPTRDENNSSPTIQVLAQSIINIEEEAQQTQNRLKSTSIAERLSQRFKGLQRNETNFSLNSDTTSTDMATTTTPPPPTTTTTAIIDSNKSKQNAFEKLINDTVLELEREKDNFITGNQPIMHEGFTENEISLNKQSSETEKEEEKNTENEKEEEERGRGREREKSNLITVISDDEDWEDIEITETAPATSTTKAGNIQKSKNKGLFQKFGIFKPKKHIPPLVYFQKKKPKEKILIPTTTSSLLPTTTTTTTIVDTTTTTSATASTVTTTTTTATTTILSTDKPYDTQITYSNTHLGFKPVVNIMDDLLPDSPCNDPIDLVPELAPLEPLQDLNDISSILNSDLSALESSVNINASENHASIEDALDFISEQQASDIQNINTISLNPSQGKTVINSIGHVGYSVQNAGENAFKFYCLLQNCSFLFSSDSIGLETHFMCEHSQLKWNGYCVLCQTQCFPNVEGNEIYSIAQEIRHMLDKHANKSNTELTTDSTTQHSTTSSQGSEERPKIKIRRLTGDCLSSAALGDTVLNQNTENSESSTTRTVPMSMLSALLVAKPKPPTKEMPPQPQMPLTEPLLLDSNNSNNIVTSSSAFTNVSKDFLITSVASAASLEKEIPLKITNVISLQDTQPVPAPAPEPPGLSQMPIIMDVRTLAPNVANINSQNIETEHLQHVETAAESLEVSQILANAGRPSLQRETSRAVDDDSPGPVVVAETVPLAQNKTGDFLITQTVSAQYNDYNSAAVGFNISIAPASLIETLPATTSITVTSRHYKCKANGCKFHSRVPVAMSDHLRFHERRNFSNNRDYFNCAFCSYQASDVDDYMKHTNQYHIINKSGSFTSATNNESNTATSLTKKIQEILNNNSSNKNNSKNQQQFQEMQTQDTYEVYIAKLKATIEEIVGPTGLADDQLYRCVVKNCRTQLTEATFLNHIMFHITTTTSNPNAYIFKCPHCTAQYHRAAGIKAHIKNHARNRYFCYLCQHTAANPGQFLKHFSDKHWYSLNMYTHELLKPKTSTDGSAEILDSAYYVAYTQELNEDEIKKFGENLILEWQRKKSGSKTHFKSSEIDLLPMSAIFQREINCGECEYKTKVRTNMFRHLQMHKQNPGTTNSSGTAKVCNVDPVNPVPCLNSNERFFDKMTNLASSSLVPSTSTASSSNNPKTTKLAVKIPYKFIEDSKRYKCGCSGCNYLNIYEENFRIHLSTLHSSEMSYRCPFCKEEICKRGISIDRIINHLRFHGGIIYRCEECNYVHHLRYVVERHINEKHATMKVNIIIHDRSNEDNDAGTIQIVQFVGKKYKDTVDNSNVAPSLNYEVSIPAFTVLNNPKGKGKWICNVCGHKASNVNQIQSHCQQQHGVKNQYKCVHCNFGSQQLSQILYHIDEKHSGKTREARSMYHKLVNSNEEVSDTRPLWQRNDPTRVRHIRGILMEDEEESEKYRKNLDLTDDVEDNDENNGNKNIDQEENNESLVTPNYIRGYEFCCFHCDFKTQIFDDLKSKHYTCAHNSKLELAKPFWFRLQKRFCCPECRTFTGNHLELQLHLQYAHNRTRYCAADISMAENEDSSQRIPCGYCSFHFVNVKQLSRHHFRTQHNANDMRIDNNRDLLEMLELGEKADLYQCSLCTDIFPNRVAVVQHACNYHAGDSVSFKDIKDDHPIYRCISCQFTNTDERVLLRHMIDHYSRFTTCHFCQEKQSSFNIYMQHCYAEHRTEIQKFRIIYPYSDTEKYLAQMLIIFRNGLVLSKHDLANTQYCSTNLIRELYVEMYKISQQPPIPRLSIARLVARKSIEAQQKQQDTPLSTLSQQDEILESLQSQSKAKRISKRRCTVAVSQEDHNKLLMTSKQTQSIDELKPDTLSRRTSIYHDNPTSVFEEQTTEFSAPLKPKKISKRRCTVAADQDSSFSKSLSNSFSKSLLIESEFSNKKRKLTHTFSPQNLSEATTAYPLNLDMEPFSFYGKKPETIDLTKIFTKVVIGGIKTPLTIDKFKLLFNIECKLNLIKCDEDNEAAQTLGYNNYKHIKKPCPASHKLNYN